MYRFSSNACSPPPLSTLFRDGEIDFGRAGSTLDNRWHPWVPQMNHEMLPVPWTNLSLVLPGTEDHLSTMRDRNDPARQITRTSSRAPRDAHSSVFIDDPSVSIGSKRFLKESRRRSQYDGVTYDVLVPGSRVGRFSVLHV